MTKPQVERPSSVLGTSPVLDVWDDPLSISIAVFDLTQIK